jgi:hypothetical protein
MVPAWRRRRRRRRRKGRGGETSPVDMVPASVSSL